MAKTERELEIELGVEESKRAKHDASFEALKEKYKTAV